MERIPVTPASAKRNASRETLAQVAARVAKRRRESERTALVREITLILGTLLLVGACFVVFRDYLRHKSKVEEQRHANAMAEMVRAEEAERVRREETAAYFQREREKREQANAEQRRKIEEKREVQKKDRERDAYFQTVKNQMRRANIDYFRNAGDEDRPEKVGQKATFVSLFPGGDCYEITADPGKPFAVRRFVDKQDPEPVPEKDFMALAGSKPYLILRLRLETKVNPTAYLVMPASVRRAMAKEHAVPSETGTFSPAKIDFGELYDTLRTMGITRPVFSYRVTFSSKQLSEPVTIPQNFDINRVLTRADVAHEVRRAYNREIETLSRKNKQAVRLIPPLEDILSKGVLTFKAVR